MLLCFMFTGQYELIEGVDVQVVSHHTCSCPLVSNPGQNYFIMGREEEMIETETGERM